MYQAHLPVSVKLDQQTRVRVFACQIGSGPGYGRVALTLNDDLCRISAVRGIRVALHDGLGPLVDFAVMQRCNRL
ncbi:hypothetical protein D3C81_2219590 [compost metagenome]